jgi:hypothetical protein
MSVQPNVQTALNLLEVPRFDTRLGGPRALSNSAESRIPDPMNYGVPHSRNTWVNLLDRYSNWSIRVTHQALTNCGVKCDPEDGGSNVLRNVSILPHHYATWISYEMFCRVTGVPSHYLQAEGYNPFLNTQINTCVCKTTSVEQSPWEAYSCSAFQRVFGISWNPKCH